MIAGIVAVALLGVASAAQAQAGGKKPVRDYYELGATWQAVRLAEQGVTWRNFNTKFPPKLWDDVRNSIEHSKLGSSLTPYEARMLTKHFFDPKQGGTHAKEEYLQTNGKYTMGDRVLVTVYRPDDNNTYKKQKLVGIVSNTYADGTVDVLTGIGPQAHPVYRLNAKPSVKVPAKPPYMYAPEIVKVGKTITPALQDGRW
jgi:hypothetical protein